MLGWIVYDNREELKRVKGRLENAIRDFCSVGKEFHMSELVSYVTNELGGYVAPDSPSRILRLLKKRGDLNYRLISRSQSKYEVVPNSPACQQEWGF